MSVEYGIINTMISGFLKRLNEPFPDRSSYRLSVRRHLGIAVFITLFLYFFKPFGLDQVRSALFLICMGFGVVTLLTCCIYDAFCQFILKIETDIPSWTLWKWVLLSTLRVAWIAIANYLYVVLIYDLPLGNLDVFLVMLRSTMLLGILPIVFSGLMAQMHAVKANAMQAQSLQLKPFDTADGQSSDEPSANFDLTPTQTLRIAYTDLRCIVAMQNYVSVYFIKEQALSSELLRNTVSKMQQKFVGTSIIRCHRSYLVNVDAIEGISGNAQGLKLKLKDVNDFEVPVSRSYIPKLRAVMN